MDKLTDEEKAIITKALDMYRRSGEEYLKNSVSQNDIFIISERVRALGRKIWDLQ